MIDRDSNYLVDGGIRTDTETPAIKALYDLTRIIPGGSARLRWLKISVDFLVKGNTLARTNPIISNGLPLALVSTQFVLSMTTAPTPAR